jgi:hypothetical protein
MDNPGTNCEIFAEAKILSDVALTMSGKFYFSTPVVQTMMIILKPVLQKIRPLSGTVVGIAG